MRASRFLLVLTLLAPAVAPAQETAAEPQPGELNPAEIVQRLPTMPARGATKESVRDRLGEPGREIPAVGDPPISRWVYDEFTVYFERNRVLHSVKRNKDPAR